MEILGFRPDGQEVVPENHALSEKSANILDPNIHGMSGRAQKLTWEDIARQASRIVSFSDLAGHERYLKCTLFGLTSSAPDFVMLIVGANAGLIGECLSCLKQAPQGSPLRRHRRDRTGARRLVDQPC